MLGREQIDQRARGRVTGITAYVLKAHIYIPLPLAKLWERLKTHNEK